MGLQHYGALNNRRRDLERIVFLGLRWLTAAEQEELLFLRVVTMAMLEGLEQARESAQSLAQIEAA
jgi:hypothetical protein